MISKWSRTMKKIFRVGKEYFENKSDAKAYRNKLEGYTPRPITMPSNILISLNNFIINLMFPKNRF